MNSVVVLCIAGFASAVALRAIDPMLGVIAHDLGVSFSDAAALVSAYSMPYAAMLLVLGPVGDAIGKARLLRVCIGGFTVAMVLSIIAPSYGWLFAARAIAGACGGGLIPVALALIGDRVPFADRQVAISRFLIVTIMGQMAGAFASGVLSEPLGWRAVFAVLASVGAGATVLVILNLETAGDSRKRLTVGGIAADYRAVFANPITPVVLGMGAAEGALILGLFPFVTLLVSAHGASGVFEAGIAIAGFALGGIAYGTIARFLIGMFRQRQLIRVGGLIAGGLYALSALPMAWTGVALCFFGAGFGYFMLHNTLQTQATELAPGARGSAMALFAAALFLGQGIGPIVGGSLSPAIGNNALFVASGVLIAGLSLAVAGLVRER
jgi:MFS transporter, DHA1 family, inner membrane transport protein